MADDRKTEVGGDFCGKGSDRQFYKFAIADGRFLDKIIPSGKKQMLIFGDNNLINFMGMLDRFNVGMNKFILIAL
jgi:hypothetical protein